MKQVLIFETGKTTCSVIPAYPGSLCPFVITEETPICRLFYKPLGEEGRFLQRLPECMEKFRGTAEWRE